MGTKYATLATSNYNASPPADDGTQSDANKVKWSTVKTKLADPVKTLADAINTALVTVFDYGPNTQSTTYQIVAGDHDKTIQLTALFTTTLIAAATGGAGFTVSISNQHSASNTIARSGSDTINGAAANYTVSAGCSVTLRVNAAATGWLVIAESIRGGAGSFTTLAASGAITQGTGSGTSAGLILQYASSSGFGGLYSTGVTPSESNYSLATNGAATYINGSTNVYGMVGNVQVSNLTSTGLTVTGAGSFTGTITGTKSGASAGTGTFIASSVTPSFEWYESDGAANGKWWSQYADAGAMTFTCTNDALNSAVAWLTVTRSGTTATSVAFTTSSFTVTGPISTANGYTINVGTGLALRSTTDATNAINFLNGTAPVGTATNAVTLYAASGELRSMDAAGNSTLLSPHDDDNNWIHHCVKGDGSEILVRMEQMVIFLDAKYGEEFAKEYGTPFIEKHQRELIDIEVTEKVKTSLEDGSVLIEDVQKMVKSWQRTK